MSSALAFAAWRRSLRSVSLVATLALALALTACGGLASGGEQHVHHASRYVEPYCSAEDTCAVDFTARGYWRMRVCRAACDDRDADLTWHRLYVER